MSTTVNLSNQYATLSGGVPLPTTPAFLPERTLAQQMALSATGVLWGIDPDLKAAHVHQVSIGIQREIGWATAVEARYVGTFGRDIWRGVDYNQIKIAPEFLADFSRARSNGYLAQQAGLGFVPTFNAAVAGSQPLTVLPTFGLLTNATALNHLQTNQVAGLADFYVQSRVAGSLGTFMPNTGIYASQAILNGGVQRLQLTPDRSSPPSSRMGCSVRSITRCRTPRPIRLERRRAASKRSWTQIARSSTPGERRSTSLTSSAPTRSTSCRSAKAGAGWIAAGS